MNSWKKKVADKLSRTLTDSPSSSPHLAAESPTRRLGIQAFPFPAMGFSDPSTPTVSSVLSLPPNGSAKSNLHKGSKSPEHKDSYSWFRSVSKGWKFKKRPAKENAIDSTQNSAKECVQNETIDAFEGGHCDLLRLKHLCDDSNETSTSENIPKNLPTLMDQSSFVSADLYEFLGSSIPNIVKGCQWVLLYSTLKHGISLRTLLRNSDDIPGPFLLIVGDMQGAVFGGLLNGPLKPTVKRKYQGTNQSFVFTTVSGRPRLFRATGANRYYFMCLNDLLALGGGGSYALCLDGDLLRGTSGPSETFGNECLAHTEEFEPKNVELWGFSHCSRYLS